MPRLPLVFVSCSAPSNRIHGLPIVCASAGRGTRPACPPRIVEWIVAVMYIPSPPMHQVDAAGSRLSKARPHRKRKSVDGTSAFHAGHAGCASLPCVLGDLRPLAIKGECSPVSASVRNAFCHVPRVRANSCRNFARARIFSFFCRAVARQPSHHPVFSISI